MYMDIHIYVHVPSMYHILNLLEINCPVSASYCICVTKLISVSVHTNNQLMVKPPTADP